MCVCVCAQDITSQRYIDASELFYADGRLQVGTSPGKIGDQTVVNIATRLDTLVTMIEDR